MITAPLLPALALAALSALPATAAPTRTHCRCAVLDSNNPFASADLFSSSTSLDPCANLGPELEYFRHAEPELYQTFFRLDQRRPTPAEHEDDGDQRPLPTSVLMELGQRNGYAGIGRDLPSAPTERPRERIVCRSEPESFSAYTGSRSTLFALQVIVALAVLACVAEFVCLMVDCFTGRREHDSPRLRLFGAEKALRAHSSSPSSSPDPASRRCASEKPSSTSTTCHAQANPDQDDEDDDEMNRPVM